MFPQFILVCVAGFSAFILWSVLRPRWDVKISADPLGNITVAGAAMSKVPHIEAFIRQHVKLSGPVVIYVTQHSAARLETKFKGSLHMGTKQQIRNFLIDLL